MALTREYKGTVLARVKRDPKFGRALYAEAVNALREGKAEEGLSILRDLVCAKREQIATAREDLKDLNNYLDLVEARARDKGKPRLTHTEVKKRYGLR